MTNWEVFSGTFVRVFTSSMEPLGFVLAVLTVFAIFGGAVFGVLFVLVFGFSESSIRGKNGFQAAYEWSKVRFSGGGNTTHSR